MDDRGVLGAVRTMETEKSKKEKGADKIHSRIQSPVPCFCLVIYLVVFFFANTTPLRSFQYPFFVLCLLVYIHTQTTGFANSEVKSLYSARKGRESPRMQTLSKGLGRFYHQSMEPNTPELLTVPVPAELQGLELLDLVQ
ncbi:hypothetical protein J3E68DRAFT_180903 [Trichoderma sp. SZMC 28012]